MTDPDPELRAAAAADQEDLPNEDARVREVYARYGLAMYYAQGMEVTLANLLMVASLGVETKTVEDLDDLEQVLTTSTAGRLLKRLWQSGLVTAQEETQCERAVNRRNFLAHHFFYEHARDFLTDGGKRTMLYEVDQARYRFMEIGRTLTRTLFALGARYGLTAEAVNEYVESTRPRE